MSEFGNSTRKSERLSGLRVKLAKNGKIAMPSGHFISRFRPRDPTHPDCSWRFCCERRRTKVPEKASRAFGHHLEVTIIWDNFFSKALGE